MRANSPRRRLLAAGLHRGSGLLLIIALLILWEASARLGWIRSPNWPPLSSVLAALLSGIASGELPSRLASTLYRLLAGFAVGGLAGTALGLLLGRNRWLRYVVNPLIETLRPIPAPAVVPPLILFLGLDDALKIFVVAIAAFFPVFTNALAAARDVDETLADTARTFGASWSRTLLSVVLPATLPAISAGLRVALGLSFVVVILAEMIAGSAGLGYYIVQMQYALRPDAMYAAVLCLMLTGYALNRLYLLAERRLLPWVGKA